MEEPIRDRISPCVPLRFPSFEKQYQYKKEQRGGELFAYSFKPVDCREWYRSFADEVITAVDKGDYLPLYRMGDGEYVFALKKNPEGSGPLWKLPLRGIAKRIIRVIRGEAQRGSGGVYTLRERRQAYDRFVDGVKHVSENGILSLGLHHTPLYDEYIPQVFNWMDNKGIDISYENYIHVYSIHVLLNGPDSKRLLEGRDVLVATGLDRKRREKIHSGLKKRGVEDVSFLSLSKRKSMLDSIDVNTIDKDVDIVLIAAGIGAVNILYQLRELKVPQIDIGFCMDIIANDDLRWERPFCVPDSDFDPKKIKY